MITKEELHELISDSKREHSFEEECVVDIVNVGSEWCNAGTCQSDGVHFHPVTEVIKEMRTRTEVEYDYQKLRLAINESTRNLEQLVVLQEVAFENQGTKEFREYQVVYRKHMCNVNNRYPQLIGSLVSTVLKNTQIPIQKKWRFVLDALDTLDVRSNKKSPLYKPQHIREQLRNYDLSDFPSETREPLQAFLKEYTPNLEFGSSAYLYRLWLKENPERISGIVERIGPQVRKNPTLISELLNPENKVHCFDERDFFEGAYPYVKDAVHALKFDSAQITNSKDQYSTRLWCKLNAEKALDIAVDSLFKSGKLNDKQGLSSWEGIPEIYEPLKNGLARKKDVRFANVILKNLDAHMMSAIEFAKTVPAIGIPPMPEYAPPCSGYDRVIDCTKGLVSLLAVGGLAFGSAFAGKYGIRAMDPAHAQARATESPLPYGFGVLSTMALCAFVSLPVGLGIAVYLTELLDFIEVPETPVQKKYKEEQLKKLNTWRLDSVSKIKQHYQQQVAI